MTKTNKLYVEKEKLLEIAGFTCEQANLPKVLIESSGLEQNLFLAAQQGFKHENICFETKCDTWAYGYHIMAVYAEYDDELHDVSYLSDEDIPLEVSVFGKQPKAGNSIYIVTDGLPQPNQETLFYCSVRENESRNPFESKNQESEIFAKIKWECYTESGFMEIKCEDSTHALLVSGELNFCMPEIPACIYKEKNIDGYVIRGTLEKAEYDIAPVLLNLKGFLFELYPKENSSEIHTIAVGKYFEMEGIEKITNATNISFRNLNQSTVGCEIENIDSVEKRYIKGITTPDTAVTAKDFEYLVCTTPGLCIDKAKAYMDKSGKIVKVVLREKSENKFAGFSKAYENEIMARIDYRRMLGTKVMLVQPEYVAVDIEGTVYIKQHMEHLAYMIDDEIRACIDYNKRSDKAFGDRVSFDELLKRVEALECVSFVSDLSMSSENAELATVSGVDLQLAVNCLCYSGKINLKQIMDV